MKRYEAETHALAADIIATLNLPKNASKGPMGDDINERWKDLYFEVLELNDEMFNISLPHLESGGVKAISRALAELADVGACLVGLREALIKLRGDNDG